MALSINPLAKLVATASSSIAQATNEANSAMSSASDALSKAKLDDTISRLSGGLDSGLNGLSSAFENVSSAAEGARDTALSGLGNPIQNTMSNGISNLQTIAGSTSNIAADISGTLNKLTGGSLAGGLQSLAGQISSAAGMLNNFLSMQRGANLPAGGELFTQSGQAIKLTPSAKNDWRVRINAPWNLFNSPLFKLLENTGGVVWPYLPNITVSTKANYSDIATTHSNYPSMSYRNSQVDAINISGEFTCETENDAAYWIAATTFFKTATKMFFGQGENAGNPPIICNLSGYGASVFDKVPVVVKSFSVDLKDSTNYIKCNTFGTNTWVPISSTITVEVQPIYNRANLRKFSLEDYARGKIGTGVGYI